MPYKKIIPCLDLKDGRLVKGIRFRNIKTAGDATEKAIRYDKDGADELAMLNISTSPEGYRATLKVIQETVDRVTVPIMVGGGIRSLESMNDLFQHGAHKIVINTAALENPELIDAAAEHFGSDRVAVAIDVLRIRSSPQLSSPSWEVYSANGLRPTGREALSWCREAAQRGAGEILLTSIDADGTQEGYDLELLAAVAGAIPIPIIASGGAGSPEHLVEALTSGKAQSVLVASLLHYGKYDVANLKQFLAEQGIPVRLQRQV